MADKTKIPKIPLKVNPEIKQIYATGAFGGFTPYDFRIVLYNDTPTPKDEFGEEMEFARIANHELIMSPIAAKELSVWLNERIGEFEGFFGVIEHKKESKENTTKGV